MSYVLSFDFPGEEGHSIDCPDLAAVRGELEGDYFGPDEIDDAMKVLTSDGVWHGEGDRIKLYIQCGASGVAEPVGINGLTEAETSATASVMGIVGVMGAVETEQFDVIRQALEIIAVGDSLDPKADAAEALRACGWWKHRASGVQGTLNGLREVAEMVAIDDGLGTVFIEFHEGCRPPAGTKLYVLAAGVGGGAK